MIKIHVLVEGQTEETFVRDVLSPYFANFDKYLVPILTTTKLVKSGPNFRGGILRYGKIKKEIRRLLGDSSAAAVTTIFDYYGLPNDFPGVSSQLPTQLQDKANFLLNEFYNDIGSNRFIPNLVFHEYEGLLFSASDEFTIVFPAGNLTNNITRIITEFSTPEHINDGLETHPSARLKSLIPKYQKRLHGSIIAKRMGIQRIRTQCRIFSNWLTKLEAIVVN